MMFIFYVFFVTTGGSFLHCLQFRHLIIYFFRKATQTHTSPKSDGEWQDVDEGIDLEDAEEEHSEVLKGLCEEVPEQTHIGGLIWDCQAGERE